MAYLRAGFAVVPLVAVLGCTTNHLTPDIQTFSASVENIVTADRATAQGRSLDARVKAARFADFAAAKVLFTIDEEDEAVCSYNRPDLRPETFEEGCALQPVALNEATGEQQKVSSQYDTLAVQAASERVIDAGDEGLLKELLADRLSSDLLTYAAALNALATATEPADISASAGKAFDAFNGLGDEVERAEVANGSPRGQRRAANRTLLTTLTSEVLETWRYNLLKSILRNADQTVEAAARQLAILSFNREKQGLDGPKTAFENATLDQVLGSAASLEAAEAARQSLADADSAAAFRRYANIAAAHSAIRQSLDAPADLARLTAANKRIVTLSDAIRAVD